MKQGTKQLVEGIRMLATAVDDMLQTYNEFPDLNDEVDLTSLIPMSLDEWYFELLAKIDELEGN